MLLWTPHSFSFHLFWIVMAPSLAILTRHDWNVLLMSSLFATNTIQGFMTTWSCNIMQTTLGSAVFLSLWLFHFGDRLLKCCFGRAFPYHVLTCCIIYIMLNMMSLHDDMLFSYINVLYVFFFSSKFSTSCPITTCSCKAVKYNPFCYCLLLLCAAHSVQSVMVQSKSERWVWLFSCH